jgi:hypothetical protein
VGGRRIDVIVQTLQIGAFLLDLVDQVHQILERSGQAVQFPDDYNIISVPSVC